MAVVTNGFLDDKNALEVNLSKHSKPKTKYAVAHMPLQKTSKLVTVSFLMNGMQ